MPTKLKPPPDHALYLSLPSRQGAKFISAAYRSYVISAHTYLGELIGRLGLGPREYRTGEGWTNTAIDVIIFERPADAVALRLAFNADEIPGTQGLDIRLMTGSQYRVRVKDR